MKSTKSTKNVFGKGCIGDSVVLWLELERRRAAKMKPPSDKIFPIFLRALRALRGEKLIGTTKNTKATKNIWKKCDRKVIIPAAFPLRGKRGSGEGGIHGI